jgi:hypothetical protein
MIVTAKNGRVVVLSGWRAWLVLIAALLAVTLVLGLMTTIVLGAALTIAVILLILLPMVIVLARLASLFKSRQP